MIGIANYLGVSFVVGALVGVIVGYFLGRSKTSGILMIDTSDPEKDSYLFEVTCPLDDLPRKKKVVFKRYEKDIID